MMPGITDLEWEAGRSILAAQKTEPPGFTADDLVRLQGLHKYGLAYQIWRRGMIVSDPFSQYFAVWDGTETDHQSPAFAIVRFRRTRIYALAIRSRIVAAGRQIEQVLGILPQASLDHEAA
jgi:hypothetical protein